MCSSTEKKMKQAGEKEMKTAEMKGLLWRKGILLCYLNKCICGSMSELEADAPRRVGQYKYSM